MTPPLVVELSTAGCDWSAFFTVQHEFGDWEPTGSFMPWQLPPQHLEEVRLFRHIPLAKVPENVAANIRSAANIGLKLVHRIRRILRHTCCQKKNENDSAY